SGPGGGALALYVKAEAAGEGGGGSATVVSSGISTRATADDRPKMSSGSAGGAEVLSSSSGRPGMVLWGNTGRGASPGAEEGATTIDWQCGQRTCKPRWAVVTAIRLPQEPHLKLTVCMREGPWGLWSLASAGAVSGERGASAP